MDLPKAAIEEIKKRLQEARQKYDAGTMTEDEIILFDSLLDSINPVLDGIEILYISYRTSPAERALAQEALRSVLQTEQELRGKLLTVDNEPFIVGIARLIKTLEAR